MNIISIPVAVYNGWFEWQLDLFWHNHKKQYGNIAAKKAHAIVIKRNNIREKKCEKYEWNINIPNSMCEAHFDYRQDLLDHNYMPINIQIGLEQIINKFKDDENLELLDCDVFHMRKHPFFDIKDDEMYVTDIYENWHLLSKTANKSVIAKYFKNDGKYYNGGFVPIIAKAKVFKQILPDWIWIHKDIVDNFGGVQHNSLRWWAGMYSLQAACERNKINMIAKDVCYLPNINTLQESHYLAHYSCDPKFDKRKYPNIDYQNFPDNMFYKAVLDWKSGSLASKEFTKLFL